MKTREQLLELIPKNSICAEIGVFEGQFSEQIINIIYPRKMYLVDIFTGQMMSGDKNGNNMKYIILDESYKNLQEKYKNNNNIIVYKGYSKDFYLTIPNNYLDFIYIDGDHSYNGVKYDLEQALIKIKENGFICGHDYTNRFIGVIQAVNEFSAKYNISFKLTTDDGCNSYIFKL